RSSLRRAFPSATCSSPILPAPNGPTTRAISCAFSVTEYNRPGPREPRMPESFLDVQIHCADHDAPEIRHCAELVRRKIEKSAPGVWTVRFGSDETAAITQFIELLCYLEEGLCRVALGNPPEFQAPKTRLFTWKL